MNIQSIKDSAARQMGQKTWDDAIQVFNEQKIAAMADLALAAQGKELADTIKELHGALQGLGRLYSRML